MPKFKTYKIVIHVAAWLLFMAFPLLFLGEGPNETSNPLQVLKTYPYWAFCLTYVFIFYINTYVFIPRFFLKGKYVIYGSLILILFASVYFLEPFDRMIRANRSGREWHRPPPGWKPSAQFNTQMPGAKFNGPRNWNGQRGGGRPRHIDTTSMFIFLMIIALSTAVKTMQQWQLTEQRMAQAEADRASAELSFLKAQINPHFLFNTLNNIYSMIIAGSEHAADSIMKLSNIMRYVTDEVTDNFVPLQSEIDCISDYIDLQRLRIGETTPVDFVVVGNPAKKVIAPLILMTFVENIFKYGISKRDYSPIEIKIIVLDSGIAFFCQNQLFLNRAEGIKESTGIGIKNTRQRLDRLYPGKYLLTIENDNEKFSVNLTLQS